MKRRDFLKLSACRSPDRGCRGLRRCPRGQRFFHTGGSSGVQPGRTCQLRPPPPGAASLTTNEGDAIPLEALEHLTRDAGAPAVYFTREISAAALVRAYEALGLDAVGPGGGQAVHRGAPPPPTTCGPELVGRPGPPAGRHHR